MEIKHFQIRNEEYGWQMNVTGIELGRMEPFAWNEFVTRLGIWVHDCGGYMTIVQAPNNWQWVYTVRSPDEDAIGYLMDDFVKENSPL
jgi:hypothetical protein